jgi:hypothetical protein
MENEQETKSKKKNFWRNLFLILVIILILDLVLGLYFNKIWGIPEDFKNELNSKKSSIASDTYISYSTDDYASENNCRDVQVPYEEQEEYLKTEYYVETIPYEEEIPLTYNADHFDTVESHDTGFGCGSLTNYAKCYRIGIMNLDTIGGIFNLKCDMRTLNNEFSQQLSTYVKPGENEILICEADVDFGEDVQLVDYTITPPTKTGTGYKDVERTRQVTAYRPITKYKTDVICE